MTPEPSAAALPTARPTPFDPPERLRLLREQRPLSRLAYPDGHVGWLVTGYDLVRSVLSDPRFSARRELLHVPVGGQRAQVTPEPAGPGIFPHLDPPEHTRYRRMLSGFFTARKLRWWESRVRRIAENCLDEMERTDPPVDLVAAFALPVPSLVICELLGVPYADRDRLQPHAAVLADLDATPRRTAEAMGALTGYFHELVARKRVEPTDDLLGVVVADDELTDEELTNIAVLLLVTGYVPTANMLALGAFALLCHPQQRSALVTGPDLAGNAVEELLRYLSIIQFDARRAALVDVELDGQLVRAGETLVLSLPAANRDAQRFTDAETLDVTRVATGHLAFGHGVHQCLGQQLARLELRIGYTALFERFPGLRMAVPAEQIRVREHLAVYGVEELPVAW